VTAIVDEYPKGSHFDPFYYRNDEVTSLMVCSSLDTFHGITAGSLSQLSGTLRTAGGRPSATGPIIDVQRMPQKKEPG